MFSALGLAVPKTATAAVVEIAETRKQQFSIHKISTSF